LDDPGLISYHIDGKRLRGERRQGAKNVVEYSSSCMDMHEDKFLTSADPDVG
jgi:hypothetical protein